MVVGEDRLCCALGQRLVQDLLPGWDMPEPINKRGIQRLWADLPRYRQQAEHVQPVLCIADTDGQCAVDLLKTWHPDAGAGRLILRLAEAEAESWALADPEAFASALEVPLNKIPRQPDALTDAKAAVLELARRSKVRAIRNEMVSDTDPTKPGTGYNTHLCKFVETRWRLLEAASRSASLKRAVARVQLLAATGP